jgi:hypothetical protein
MTAKSARSNQNTNKEWQLHQQIGKNEIYPKKQHGLSKKWWNYHILSNTTNYWPIGILDDLLNLYKALKSKDASKEEVAMQKNYDLLMANDIWEMTNLLKYRKNVGRKYVLFTKKNAWSIIVRYKARLVAKGYF